MTLPDGRQIDVMFGSSSPSWLRYAKDRLNTLASFSAGWDGHGAHPMSGDALLMFLHAVQRVAGPATPMPALFLSPDGGLPMEWRRGGWDIEIEARPNGDIEGYARRLSDGKELLSESLLGLDTFGLAMTEIEST